MNIIRVVLLLTTQNPIANRSPIRKVGGDGVGVDATAGVAKRFAGPETEGGSGFPALARWPPPVRFPAGLRLGSSSACRISALVVE